MKLSHLQQTDYLKLALPLVFAGVFFFFNRFVFSSLFYLVGWYLGLGLLIWDKNQLYKYYYESVHLEKDQFARLITRSLLFIVAYFGLSIFLITSSGSSLGMGIVAGIGLALAVELWQSKNYVEFFNQYFIQAKKTWDKKEIDWFVKLFIVFYCVTTLLGAI